jgi:hypothetical protein
VSLEIPLSAFTPSLAMRNKVGQIALQTQDSAGAPTIGSNFVVYLDNLYFH